MKVVSAWVLALLVIIGGGVGIVAGVGVTAPAPVARIDQIALNAAASANDPHVSSVTWIYTDRYGADIVTHGLNPGRPWPPVYLLEMRGRFILGPVNEAGTQSAPVFSVMEVIVNAQTLNTMTADSSSGWDPLTSYGTPETDSLVGLKPGKGHTGA
jgi:NAD(P)H-dependent flavin oxidoreductase YrpB (nitropropane dioxygenase family)